jgi:hypothetical protein
MDEAAHIMDSSSTDRAAGTNTVDDGDGNQPARGQVPDRDSTDPQQLGTMVARWVSDIRRHGRALGKAPRAAEAYIAEMARSTADIDKIYNEWHDHCQSISVDPVDAPTDAILGAVDSYASHLDANGVSYSYFNARMRIVSNVYKYLRTVDINTKVVKDLRKRLSKSGNRGPQRVTTRSFNGGSVFRALAEYQRSNEFRALDKLDGDRELFYRRAFTFSGRTDACARADDFKHLMLTTECLQPLNKHGGTLELTSAGLRECKKFVIAYKGSKTTGTALTTSSMINRARATFVSDAKLKDTAEFLASYIEITTQKREQMHEHERQNVLISSATCQRPAYTLRKNKVSGIKERHYADCGGHCGMYHPLSADTIAKDTTWCLQLAGVDTREFKSHQSRGNAETVLVYASKYSDTFELDEARKRARHSEQTMKKFYLRDPDPVFMAKMNRIAATKRRNMVPEEFLRLD